MFGVIKPKIPRHAVVLVANKPSFAAHVARHLLKCNPKRPVALVAASEASAYREIAHTLSRGEAKVEFFPDESKRANRIAFLYEGISMALGPPLALIELSEFNVNPASFVAGTSMTVVSKNDSQLVTPLMPLARHFGYGRFFKLVWIEPQPTTDYPFRGKKFERCFDFDSAFTGLKKIWDLSCVTSNPAFRKSFDYSQFGSAGGLLEWGLTEGPSLFIATMGYKAPEFQ